MRCSKRKSRARLCSPDETWSLEPMLQQANQNQKNCCTQSAVVWVRNDRAKASSEFKSSQVTNAQRLALAL